MDAYVINYSVKERKTPTKRGSVLISFHTTADEVTRLWAELPL